MFNVRTDLAVETREMYKSKFNREIDGVIVEERELDDVKITNVDVIDENGAKVMGKPIGRYVTLDMPEYTHYDGAIKDQVA
ncbi:MAG: GPR endopeptidase, partial [Sarcina sp.]